MRDHPLFTIPSAAGTFFCPDSPKSAPLTYREFRLAEDLRNFRCRVGVLDRLLADQVPEHRFDAVKSIRNGF